jgi:hypothetical protein
MFLQRLKNPKHKYIALGIGLVVSVTTVLPLSAQGVSSIAQGFQTDDKSMVSGAIVSLKDGSPNTVELSNVTNLDQMIGVAGNKSVIELSSSAAGVQVVTNGVTPTLVSDINGDIKSGDKITASPIAGVGMRATNSTLVIGSALGDLSSAKKEARTVKDKSGKEVQVHIGAVAVQVDKVFYEAPSDQNTFLPPALQDFADGLAGHKVSPVRVVVAALLVIFLFAAVTILLYSAVRSSIISIGRNPLSESAVRKSLMQVGLTVTGIFVFTTIVIYLILTL